MPVFSLMVLLVFAGFYSLYSASVRADAPENLKFEGRLRQHPAVTQISGSGFLLIALALAISTEGTGAGVFTYFILFMTTGSLVVLLAPLQLLNYGGLLTVFGLMVLVETLLF